jgi:hypothetical protein
MCIRRRPIRGFPQVAREHLGLVREHLGFVCELFASLRLLLPPMRGHFDTNS